jgi:hypothetical protein
MVQGAKEAVMSYIKAGSGRVGRCIWAGPKSRRSAGVHVQSYGPLHGTDRKVGKFRNKAQAFAQREQSELAMARPDLQPSAGIQVSIAYWLCGRATPRVM